MTPREPLRSILTRHLRELTREPRPVQSRGHQRAEEYIRRCLEQAGYGVRVCRFEGGGFDVINICTVPIPPRNDLPLFIVGAHYDSVTGSPGADDNASGIAALLALAAAFQESRPNMASWDCRLQFAAYDLEEHGMLGSWTHSRELRQSASPVKGMIALEMLAYADQCPGSQRLPPHLVGIYPDVGNFIGICGNESSRNLVNLFEAGMRCVTALPVESLVVPGKGEAISEVRLSDHSSFWDDGYPALMVTDTSFFRNPHYHKPSDTLETLDLTFFERVTRALYEGVQRILGP
jgi:Zn-dependent M28 family amino/carboxypeptidase